MSLKSGRTAIVSLGLSCQTAHQIKRHRDALAEAVGEGDLSIASMYFDYLITGRESAFSAVSGEFPELHRQEELTVHAHSPYWAERDIWFVHNFRAGGQLAGAIDLANEFPSGASKISYLREKFLSLRDQERIVFVMGNAQSNLAQFTSGADDYARLFLIDRPFAERLDLALSRRFGSAYSGLLLVEATSDAPDWQQGRIVRRAVPSSAEWTGDDAGWERVLTAEVPRMLQRTDISAGGEAVAWAHQAG